jgi:hypothetical protein
MCLDLIMTEYPSCIHEFGSVLLTEHMKTSTERVPV